MSGTQKITVVGKKMTAKWVLSLTKKEFVRHYKGTFEDVEKAWLEVEKLKK